MNYFEAIANLKKKELSSLYLISGEESYLANKFEKAVIKKTFPGNNTDGVQILSTEASVDEIVNSVESMPFFSEKNLIIVRNSTLFKERKNANEKQANRNEEKLIQLFSDMPTYSILLLVTVDKIDKRRKLYKAIDKHGIHVEALPIKARDIKDWLQNKLYEIHREFSREAYEYFIEATSVMAQISLGYLEQEFEKLTLYTDKTRIEKEDLIKVFSSIPEVSIFAMIDAISEKKLKQALVLLEEQLIAGEHPLRLITMLSRHTRQLLQVNVLLRQGATSRQIAESLGVVPFIAERLMKKSRSFKQEVLQQVLIDLAEVDYQLKSSQADCIALERIIINLCSE